MTGEEWREQQDLAEALAGEGTTKGMRYIFCKRCGCQLWLDEERKRQLCLACEKPVARSIFLTLLFIILTALTLLAAAGAFGSPLLDAIEAVESGGFNHATGPCGERGPFQFRARTWAHISALRVQRGLIVFGFRECTSPGPARLYAQTYVEWVTERLRFHLKRDPTIQEVYAAWNMGVTGFGKRGFSISRCPVSVQNRSQRVSNLAGRVPWRRECGAVPRKSARPPL